MARGRLRSAAAASDSHMAAAMTASEPEPFSSKNWMSASFSCSSNFRLAPGAAQLMRRHAAAHAIVGANAIAVRGSSCSAYGGRWQEPTHIPCGEAGGSSTSVLIGGSLGVALRLLRLLRRLRRLRLVVGIVGTAMAVVLLLPVR